MVAKGLFLTRASPRCECGALFVPLVCVFGTGRGSPGFGVVCHVGLVLHPDGLLLQVCLQHPPTLRAHHMHTLWTLGNATATAAAVLLRYVLMLQAHCAWQARFLWGIDLPC